LGGCGAGCGTGCGGKARGAMARQEELEIEIDPNGQVRVHVKGAGGERCLEYVEVFRRLLGPVTDEKLTPEYYEAETRVQAHVEQRSRFRDL
jgi:hypothetical protein